MSKISVEWITQLLREFLVRDRKTPVGTIITMAIRGCDCTLILLIVRYDLYFSLAESLTYQDFGGVCAGVAGGLLVFDVTGGLCIIFGLGGCWVCGVECVLLCAGAAG
jgi:hypothetical protein